MLLELLPEVLLLTNVLVVGLPLSFDPLDESSDDDDGDDDDDDSDASDSDDDVLLDPEFVEFELSAVEDLFEASGCAKSLIDMTCMSHDDIFSLDAASGRFISNRVHKSLRFAKVGSARAFLEAFLEFL